MRVIAGKYKGRKLKYPKNKNTRPTSDMVKEAIFAKLYDKVKNAVVLDAFCGSGQIGIEALSRDAKKVFFVDDNFDAIKVVKENLQNLNLNSQSQIFLLPVLKALATIEEVFDIIFLDPPYSYKKYDKFFMLLKVNNIINENTVIVCEHKKDVTFKFKGFEMFSTKNYGLKAVSYFKVIN